MGHYSKDLTNQNELSVSRNRIIVRTSILGVVVNILLSLFKVVVGLLSNSIAMILDAVNNLSDALSSIITIVGTKLSSKTPDKKHPLGHGRIEYLSAILVSAIVLYAGLTSAVESVKKILSPQLPSYSSISFAIISVAVVVKLILGQYVKSVGGKINSTALKASGSDAFFDALLSFSVLVSAIIYTFFSVSLEAYVGLVISIVIIKAGIDMMLDTVSDIIGRRADPDLVKKLKEIILEEPQVMGAYDLILNNYGPDINYGSVHIELPDYMNVEEVDVLTRKLQDRIYRKTGVIMTGIGVYSYNTKNELVADIRNKIMKAVMSNEWVLQLHGFYADIEKKVIRFDVVLSFDVSFEEAYEIIKSQVCVLFPDWDFQIVPDLDISD